MHIHANRAVVDAAKQARRAGEKECACVARVRFVVFPGLVIRRSHLVFRASLRCDWERQEKKAAAGVFGDRVSHMF